MPAPNISRPSLTQIELGKRNLSVIELKKITDILSISMDKLLSSDFNYYELYEEHLSGAEYKKLPYGPVPQKLDSIINQMIASKQLKIFKADYHGYPQTRYIPLSKPDLSSFSASEKDVIDELKTRIWRSLPALTAVRQATCRPVVVSF